MVKGTCQVYSNSTERSTWESDSGSFGQHIPTHPPFIEPQVSPLCWLAAKLLASHEEFCSTDLVHDLWQLYRQFRNSATFLKQASKQARKFHLSFHKISPLDPHHGKWISSHIFKSYTTYLDAFYYYLSI
jgi:hypothetical protein